MPGNTYLLFVTASRLSQRTKFTERKKSLLVCSDLITRPILFCFYFASVPPSTPTLMHNELWTFINTSLELPRNNRDFPGVMPLSVCRQDLPLLQGTMDHFFTEYVVSFKADGVRKLMATWTLSNGQSVLFVLERDRTIRMLNLPFPAQAFAGTIMDVEFIASHNTFLLFDLFTLCGNKVFHETYYHRLHFARAFLEFVALSVPSVTKVPNAVYPGAAQSAQSANSILTFTKHSSVKLAVKTIFFASAVKLMRQIEWPYPSDGLVWTRVNKTLIFKKTRTQDVFKFKPADRITLDFKFDSPVLCSSICHASSKWPKLKVPTKFYKTVPNATASLLTVHDGRQLAFGTTRVTNVKKEPLKLGAIYECKWCRENEEWIPVTLRTDREKANNLVTIYRTIQNILENITFSELE